jgi:hypothetical protein
MSQKLVDTTPKPVENIAIETPTGLEPSPSVEEMHAQEKNLTEVIGRAAIISAQKYGLNFVWNLKTKERIPLEEALEIIRRNPGLVYFDFEAFGDLVLNPSDEPVVKNLVTKPATKPESTAIEADSMPDDLERPEQSTPISSTQKPDGTTTWGGMLTSPGQQVYIHPSGIIRIEIEGPIRIQRGKSQNIRVLKITRITRQVTVARPPEPRRVEEIDESDF